MLGFNDVSPGGLEFLLFQALLCFPVCPLLLKHTSLLLQLLVLSLQVLLHLLMTPLKLQRHTQDKGGQQSLRTESTVTHLASQKYGIIPFKMYCTSTSLKRLKDLGL